jgi:hypothetical protein
MAETLKSARYGHIMSPPWHTIPADCPDIFIDHPWLDNYRLV